MKSIGSCFRSILPGIVTLTLALVWAAPADASPRKCSIPPGSTSRSDGGPPFLMIDGVVVGDTETNMDPGGKYWYSTPEGRVTVSNDQIEYILITCVEGLVNGEVVARGTISVGTRHGVEGMLRRYLAELAEMQEDYRRANGAYAAWAQFVDFRLTRHPVGVDMRVVDGGWAASMVATTASKRGCRVAVGTAAAPGTVSGQVECFDRGE